MTWFVLIIGAWHAAGVPVATVLQRRLPFSTGTYFAIAWCALPVAYSVIAIPLGLLGVDPLVILGLVASLLVLVGFGQKGWGAWPEHLRRAPLVFAAPALLGFVVVAASPDLDVRSDALAHVSAVRASMEESSVFPVGGFHGDEASRGIDPRFGTLHALYGAVARAFGLSAETVWGLMRGVGVIVLLSGGLALLRAVSASPWSVSLGFLAIVGAVGGSFYNPLIVAAYPLWFGLGVTWATLALAFSPREVSVWAMAAVFGVVLAGLAGMHFFAFMLAGFLLGTRWLSAPRGVWSTELKALGLAATLSLPFVVLRLVSSYANVNPIHQKVWQTLEWSPGLYSANPLFVTKWLGAIGIVSVVFGVWRYSAMRARFAFRWLMLTVLAVALWIGNPWFLTPSMELIRFLPLRLVMAIGTPFLVAMLLDELGRARTVVRIIVAVLLVAAAVQRVGALFETSAALDSRAWTAELGPQIGETGDEPIVLASDPYTMLAAHAQFGVHVVAVPDGRSSPRDPEAIERLRDSWRILSPTVDGAATDEVLRRRSVTHVLLNRRLPAGLASYEFPVPARAASDWVRKFERNPDRFELVAESPEMFLYKLLRETDAPWNEDYLESCADPFEPGSQPEFEAGEGFVLEAVDCAVEQSEGSARLVVEGSLVWAGEGSAPDRQLVLRLDRAPGSVPSSLAFIGKPLRKLGERLGRPRERFRWTLYPKDGECPTWLAGENGRVDLSIEVRLSPNVPAGTYEVSLAVRDRSIFEPIRARDLFVDEDSFQGPTIGRIQIP